MMENYNYIDLLTGENNENNLTDIINNIINNGSIGGVKVS